MALTVSAREQKRNGVYYTDAAIARFLACWAIRTAGSRVLEPCFGEGVFLRATLERQSGLGGEVCITGVDLDPRAWAVARSVFPALDLRPGDFFEVSPEGLGAFDAVIGNPPFIRYQRFTGGARARALGRAA